jgi:cell division protein FtsI (penicillin-binding protein 3)|tara:strand:- start:19048 stop:20781 length:1734 start_codon:yes stop_codon:yes gene_type:complete
MKNKKNKNFFLHNQKSFFFEDFLESSQKEKIINKAKISDDRFYILFSIFFSLILIFSISIFSISIQSSNFQEYKEVSENSLILRRDVVDRNGELVARNINAYHAAIKPNLIKNKENFAINIKLNFPEISLSELKKNLKNKKYFYLKKRLTEEEKNKLWSFGEKGIIIEPFQSRVYPHGKLFSHVLGQIDDDNYGISGIEKFFDRDLKDKEKINNSLSLSLDSNIQFLINVELNKAMQDFKTNAAGALLMNVNNGEVLSLVSLPDYNVNTRKNIADPKYMNQITKGVFELGSVFKTFTLALAIEENILLPKTLIKNIPNKVNCSKFQIRDIHEFPEELSAEDILIRSSNIGSLMIGRKIGEKKLNAFLENLGLLKTLDFELEEIGKPLNFNWEKCKLETVSFGHGITTTPLQAAAAYASIANGGYIINPTLKLSKNLDIINQKSIISKSTSDQMNKILRKVVTDKEGTGSFADIFGYDVGGKTGTAKSYTDKSVNINTFISIFPSQNPKYVLLIILDDPKAAPHISYNYRGQIVKNISRNEAGWNSVYVAGKIIEKIGPILAINNDEVHNVYVVKKNN